MPRYTVHLYPICRVEVTGIEADSPEAAMALAEEHVGMYGLFPESGRVYASALPRRSSPPEESPFAMEVRNCGYTEGTDGALVDELDAEGDVIDSHEFTASGEREAVPQDITAEFEAAARMAALADPVHDLALKSERDAAIRNAHLALQVFRAITAAMETLRHGEIGANTAYLMAAILDRNSGYMEFFRPLDEDEQEFADIISAAFPADHPVHKHLIVTEEEHEDYGPDDLCECGRLNRECATNEDATALHADR